MQFKSTLALCAAVLAAVSEGRIAFTTLPSSVNVGSPVQLAWSGADGTPITIFLKRGSSNNLQTVALITGNASGNSYTWTPSSDLQNGSDYALQITQDDTDINYTGLFSISGGQSGSASTLSASSSTSSSYANGTTTAAPVGTAPASAGMTGTAAPRNTTFSTATLSATSSGATDMSGSPTTVTGEGVASSTSSATTSSSSAKSTNGAVNVASNFGLLFAGFAAVAYLG